MESYLACGSELGATAEDGYTQIINNMEKDMVLQVEAKMIAGNPIEANLQVVEDQVYRSHPFATRRRRLFEYRKRGSSEHNTDFVKAMMMQAKEAELVNMTVIYLTLDKILDVELVRKWYDKAEARAEAKQPDTAQYKAKMEDLLDLAEKLEALEASTQVHTKKAPREQKDTAKAVNTNLPKRDQSRGREGITCFKCG
jgi:hypothetical protein